MRNLLQYTLDLFAPRAPERTEPPGSLIAPPVEGLAPAVFRHPRANREARLGDAIVAYEFKRGKRRTIGFMVGPDGLVVSAPKWVSLVDVHAALVEKASWIVKKLGQTRERHERLVSSRIEWKDGARFLFWAHRCAWYWTHPTPLAMPARCCRTTRRRCPVSHACACVLVCRTMQALIGFATPYRPG